MVYHAAGLEGRHMNFARDKHTRLNEAGYSFREVSSRYTLGDSEKKQLPKIAQS